MLFLLVIFFAARGFKKCDNIDQVQAVRPPLDENYWVLEMAENVLGLPIFQEIIADGPTKEIQSATSFYT